MRYTALIFAICALSSEAIALELAECDRVTAVSHGGESDHVDLGEGRVMWRDWWSQEGTATNFKLVDCAPGRMLDVRAAETNMSRERTGFDRTDDVLKVLAFHDSGARAFATFERMAIDLERVGEDVAITTLMAEVCACAAAYPDMRGEKTAFVLEDVRRAPWGTDEGDNQ